MLVWKSPLQLPTAYAKGPEDKKSGGTPPLALNCCKSRTGLPGSPVLLPSLPASLLPNPALSCSTNMSLKLNSVPDLTAPPLSWACLVSHRTLTLRARRQKEQKQGQGRGTHCPPWSCPFSPAKTAGSAGAARGSGCSLASPGWPMHITGGAGAGGGAGLEWRSDGVPTALASPCLQGCTITTGCGATPERSGCGTRADSRAFVEP